MNEPVRKSMLDSVKHNLEAAERITFCTRFIYFGEYQDTAENFQKQVVEIINDLNAKYIDSNILGLLIIYQKCFIHLVTAPEEIIFRHLKAIFEKEKEIKLGKVFHLPVQHHLYRPYITKWYSIITKSPILLEKLENTDLPELEKHVRNLMIKIYKLCEFLMDTNIKTGDPISDILKDVEETASEFLPETAVLEYLIKSNSPVFLDLRIQFQIFMAIPYINFYSDRVWPTPCDFMPTFSFSKATSGKEEEKENREKSTS